MEYYKIEADLRKNVGGVLIRCVEMNFSSYRQSNFG